MFDGLVGGVDWMYDSGRRIGPGWERPISLTDIRQLAGKEAITVKAINGMSGDTSGTYEFRIGSRRILVLFIGEGSDVVVQLRP